MKIYNSEKLLARLEKNGAHKPRLVRNLLQNCGHFIGDFYIIEDNEKLPEDGNPYGVLLALLEARFGDEVPLAFADKKVLYTIDHVELEEVAEKYKIQLPEEE